MLDRWPRFSSSVQYIGGVNVHSPPCFRYQGAITASLLGLFAGEGETAVYVRRYGRKGAGKVFTASVVDRIWVCDNILLAA
jgi:hypothetical protein